MTTKNIDMDKTIQKSLNNLVSYLSDILKKEQKKISKMKGSEKQEYEKRNKEQIESLKFLKIIAKNPKQYLYTKKDWIYNKDTDGETIYDKLKSLTCNNLPSISREALTTIFKISNYHYNYSLSNKEQKQWIIYSNDNINEDIKKFLKINKELALLNGSLLLRKMQESLSISDFIPTKSFVIER